MSGNARQGLDKTLLAATLLLLVVGILMVFSSSAILAGEKYGHPLYFFVHQVFGVLVGLVVLAAAASFHKDIFNSTAAVYGLLIVSFILLLLCLVMPPVANTQRWVFLFGLRFQPSELAKIALVLFTAHYCHSRKDRLHEWKIVLVPFLVIMVFVVLILKQPDYSTAVFLFAVSSAMLFLGGVRLRYFLAAGAGALGVFFFFLLRADYRMDRILEFLTMEKDVLGKSFQVIQSKLAVGAGGILGVNLGGSIQKLFFLPCAHTDFIYAILGEEFGLLGTVFTLTLFFIFLWRGLAIALRTADPLHKLVAAGLTLMITAQSLLNISIVLGLGPATGLPLPFISFGRSALLCSLAAAGLLLNISRRKRESGGLT
ncbi:MAG: putative peptidoglycan glycosyltransferase FtsW [Acidobacteriota bacterium]|nr:putative peptidoglycan glycosyltransferase FtsW [Acidobacteriota bacterium]